MKLDGNLAKKVRDEEGSGFETDSLIVTKQREWKTREVDGFLAVQGTFVPDHRVKVRRESQW